MILQPLVENAIKHGPGLTSERVDIRVTAERSNGQLDITVRDNGRGCKDVHGAVAGTGIGSSQCAGTVTASVRQRC
ncbi:MAG: hypothetical protein IPG69_08300 [Flavobacteriales bacterium]|nr:hypothetical protein [Flavobacteriales bacterium]